MGTLRILLVKCNFRFHSLMTRVYFARVRVMVFLITEEMWLTPVSWGSDLFIPPPPNLSPKVYQDFFAPSRTNYLVQSWVKMIAWQSASPPRADTSEAGNEQLAVRSAVCLDYLRGMLWRTWIRAKTGLDISTKNCARWRNAG